MSDPFPRTADFDERFGAGARRNRNRCPQLGISPGATLPQNGLPMAEQATPVREAAEFALALLLR